MNVIEQNKVTIWQMFKAVEQKGFTAEVGPLRKLARSLASTKNYWRAYRRPARASRHNIAICSEWKTA